MGKADTAHVPRAGGPMATLYTLGEVSFLWAKAALTRTLAGEQAVHRWPWRGAGHPLRTRRELFLWMLNPGSLGV